MQRHLPMLAAVVLAGGLYAAIETQATPPPTLYKVVPGAVVRKTPPQHPPVSIGASFTLVEASDGHPASEIGADGTPVVNGGACLVFQDGRNVLSCTTQAQCDTAAAPARSTGYCDAVDGGTGTCWYKQNKPFHFAAGTGYMVDEFCIKSGSDKSLVVGVVNELPIRAGRPLGPQHKLRWRLTTCQGLVKGGCGKPNAVQGVDLKTRFGPIEEF